MCLHSLYYLADISNILLFTILSIVYLNSLSSLAAFFFAIYIILWSSSLKYVLFHSRFNRGCSNSDRFDHYSVSRVLAYNHNSLRILSLLYSVVHFNARRRLRKGSICLQHEPITALARNIHRKSYCPLIHIDQYARSGIIDRYTLKVMYRMLVSHLQRICRNRLYTEISRYSQQHRGVIEF